ncbi:MAG: type II toxin-antitoxin system PemK/MazF family toxin [Acidobacteria bacterium]|nr:type II toxin-antitoxin system PemK/MazF family toxin [Acidobacteriota bacterium]MBI3424150.1 type II toxin-antitoxin system PemK/MazF family toxin [Acidobacteriota bacterium]
MFGEIFLCQLPFTNGAVSKARPVLVLFDLPQDAVICRVTSVLHAGPLDLALRDWAQAGLAKPSAARLDRLVTAEKTLLTRRLGQLTAHDEAAVRVAWNQHMKL